MKDETETQTSVIRFILQPFLSAPRTGVEPVPTPRQGVMLAVTPTRHWSSDRSAHRANWGIEPSPRHSQCRVLPLHQDRHSSFSRRKRRESNPHRPCTGRSRLANACDDAGIRLSSEAVGSGQSAVGSEENLFLLSTADCGLPTHSCPRQESNLDFEFRKLV